MESVKNSPNLTLDITSEFQDCPTPFIKKLLNSDYSWEAWNEKNFKRDMLRYILLPKPKRPFEELIGDGIAKISLTMKLLRDIVTT